MKQSSLTIALEFLALGSGYAQQKKEDTFAQPTHVEGRRINAEGETTRTFVADYTYYDDGKVKLFEFPDFHVVSGYAFDGDYMVSNCTSHASGYPYYMDCLRYTYEEGKIVHIVHSWDQMNAPENWQYTYDEFGRLKQKDYCEGYEVSYHEHYIYEYDDKCNIVTEGHWTSWTGMKLEKKTVFHYDDSYVLETKLVENYNGTGVMTSSSLTTYTYTPAGDVKEQLTQTLVDEEWVNSSIQRYVFDEQYRVVEQQNGSWSEEDCDWNITKKITFEYEAVEDGYLYTVSFYKKIGEEWVWDVFNNQTILFGSQLKNQQSCLRFFVYEIMAGSGQINQFEFTFVDTPEPNYMNVEDTQQMPCTVHPNPTTGLVTITGKNLKQAEVLNALGQRVATIAGEGNTFSIDIAKLPAGVYFVTVSDTEGRKCVRKVVKE